MEFGSHLDPAVLLAVDLVNRLTPGWSHGRAWTVDGRGAAREQIVAALADRPNRARAWTTADEDALDDLVTVAGRLRRVFEAVDRGDVDAGAHALNQVLDDYEARPELSRHDGQPWHLHFHAGTADPVGGIAAGCATALAMVVGSDAVHRLGVCHADACDRVFVDASRNGTRRFCSTACQNRAKAAAFRARRSAPTP